MAKKKTNTLSVVPYYTLANGTVRSIDVEKESRKNVSSRKRSA